MIFGKPKDSSSQPEQLAYLIEHQPQSAKEELHADAILEGWALSSAGPVRLNLLVDSEPIAYWLCNRVRYDVLSEFSESHANLMAGFSIALPFLQLIKIGPGRISVELEGAESREVIWRWDNGYPGKEESEAILKLVDLVEQRGAISYAKSIAREKSTSKPTGLFLYEGDFESLKASLRSLGSQAAEFSSLNILASGTHRSTELDSKLSEIGIPQLSVVRDVKSFLSSLSSHDLVFCSRSGVDLANFRLAHLVSDYLEMSSVRIIEPCLYGGDFGLVPPGGVKLASLAEVTDYSKTNLPLLLENSSEKASLAWLATVDVFEEIVKEDISLSSKPLLSHVDLRQPITSLTSDPKQFSEVLRAQAEGLVEDKSRGKRKVSSSKEVLLLVCDEDHFEKEDTDLLELINIAESQGTEIFFVLEKPNQQVGGCKEAEKRKLIHGHSSLYFSEVEEFFRGVKNGWLVAANWKNLSAAHVLAYLTGYKVAGLLGEEYLKDFSTSEIDKCVSHSAALQGVFIPLAGSAFKVSSILKEKLLGAKELVNISELKEPLLPALESAHISMEHRLAKDHGKRKAVSLILPVYNALDSLQSCLRSIEPELNESVELIIVNDSSDSFTSEWLRSYAKRVERVSLIEHEENKGFIAACKSGFSAASQENDIIVINSDVVLSPGTVEKISDAAYSSWRSGVASSLSTSSHHLQMEINPGESLLEAQDYLSQEIKAQYPTVITPEGQFIYFRRWALDRFGFFDKAYGRGFCEESDLCMRYFLNGVDTVCADNSIIHHRHAASFGEQKKNELILKNRPIFDARWEAAYEIVYQTFLRRDPLKSVRAKYKKHAISLDGPELGINLLESYQELSKVKSGRKKAILKDAEVVFILPSVVLGGGTLSVLQHVEELIQRGVKARVVSLTVPSITKLPLLSPPIVVSQRELFELDWNYQKVVATFWLTAFFVKELLKRNKGLKGYYYIQDYEPWFYSKPNEFFQVKDAEETYSLGLQNVAKTSFLKERVHKEHGQDVSLVTPGVNKSVFYKGEQEKYFGPPRLTALFRPSTTRRGSSEMIRVFEQLTQRIPELRIRLFGAESGLPNSLAGKVELLGRLTPNEVGNLYRDSDIVLDLSHWHGFGRMGAESMSCGAVPVLSASGGIDSYAKHGKNSLVVPIGDIDAAVESIIKLACDEQYRLELRKQGLKDSINLDESKATDDWLKLFSLKSSIVTSKQISQAGGSLHQSMSTASSRASKSL